MKLSRIVKSPLTYIAIVVAIAITAFVAGLFVSARMSNLTASGVKEVVVLRTVTYQNPDGTWPSPVPTPAPLSGQSGEEDDVLYYYDDDVLHPDAHGVATMGKLLYLYDGGSIQLPTDVYVEEIWHGGAVCDDWPDCPEYPHYTLARGDDRVATDRYGKPFHTWSISSESKPAPSAFEFLNK